VDERQAVMSALLQLGAMPAGMELFPAADDESWTLIQRVIDESDYYLLIVGGRYGSVTPEGVSYTEKEYNYAVAQGKPVMAFLHGAPERIPVGKSDIDAVVRQKLEAFVERVKKAKHVKHWSSAEDLAGKIALSFASFTRTHAAVGWVRGDAGDSPGTLKALAAAQARVSELEAQLGTQASGPPPGAAGLADFDERMDLDVLATVRITNLVYEIGGLSERQSVSVRTSISWNEVLAELGPMMVNEARQDALHKRFVAAVTRLSREDIIHAADEWLSPQIPAKRRTGSKVGAKAPLRLKVVEVKPEMNDFETALLQLEALGLTAQSDRKRAVADRGTYWSLTSWGRLRLLRLRAIRSGRSRPPVELDEDLTEESE
jgi:hypothetical protein